MDFQQIFLIAAIMGCATIVVAHVLSIADGLASERWPEVKATVVESSVSGGGEGGFSVAVAYTYTVDGTGYSDDRLSFGQSMTGGSRAWAEERIRGLSPGSTVPVYYNPRNPSVATVRRGVPGRLYFGAIVSLVVLLGFVIAFMRLRT